MTPIPPHELLAMACEFVVGPEPLVNGHPLWWRHFDDPPAHHAVRVRNMDPGRWAILGSGGCLNKLGDWEYQPLNSNRPDDFYRRCRYASVHEAVHYYRHWYKAVEEFALNKIRAAGLEITDDMPLEIYRKIVVNYDEIPPDLLKFPYALPTNP